MATETRPFTSYEDVERHALKLRLRSETQKLRFENHFRALADKEVRTALLKGAVKDVVSDFKPMQRVTELMAGGGVTSQLVMGLFTRRGGIMKRVLGSVVLPNLLAKVPWSKLAGTLGTKMRSDADHAHVGNGTDPSG